MKAYFIGWMLLYLALTLYNNRFYAEATPKAGGTQLLLVQFPLVILSVYYGLIYDVFSRDLLNLPTFALGILGGHALFGLSLLATHQNLRETLLHWCDFSGMWRFLKFNPDIIIRFFSISVMEELIYRVAAQNILLELGLRPWLAIVLVAAAFAVVHWHFFRNPPIQSLEFATFSLMLGVLYFWSGSLLLVVTVHTVRNLNIVYVEYLLKEAELGDEEKAQAALDEEYRVRRAGTT